MNEIIINQQHCISPEVIYCDDSSDGRQDEIEYIRRQITRAVVRRDHDKTLFSHTRNLIKEYTRKSGKNECEFFSKHSEYFCKYLAQQMLEALFVVKRRSRSTEEPVPKSPRFDLFESCVEKLTKLFSFYVPENAIHSIKNFVADVIAQHLVPVFLLCRRRFQHIAESLIDQISDIMRVERRALIYRFWGEVFEHWIFLKINEPQNTHDLDVYLFVWAHVNRIEYYSGQNFKSLLSALIYLSVDEQFVLSLIEDIYRNSAENKNDVPFSLTSTIRPRFADILINMRNIISAQNTERATAALNSLVLLMDRVDQSLINEHAQNLLITLKVASIAIGDMCVPAWIKFMRKLHKNEFQKSASQIVTALVPLLKYDSSKNIFDEFFQICGNELYTCSKEEYVKVNRIFLIMLDHNALKIEKRLPANYVKKLSSGSSAYDIVQTCSELLMTETIDLYDIILDLLLRMIDKCDDLLQIDSSQLARALIFSLQKVYTPSLKTKIAKCLGNIGLLDLDGSSSSLMSRNQDQQCGKSTTNFVNVFSDDKVQFAAEFIKGILCKVGECTLSETVNKIENCVAYILVLLKKTGLYKEVSKNLQAEFAATLNTIQCTPKIKEFFEFLEDLGIKEQSENLSLVDCSSDHNSWMELVYYTSVNKLEDDLLMNMFASLRSIDHNAIAGSIMCNFYPHLIVQAIFEDNEQILKLFESEFVALFRAIIDGKVSWANEAARITFYIIDILERIAYNRTQQKRSIRYKDKVALQLNELVAKVLSATDGPNLYTSMPLSVLVARKCNYYFRAMRWVEQFAANNTSDGSFQREFYFVLEQLYAHLENSDGVLGTFQVIRDHTIPEPREHILALKVKGNYVDALPLCQNVPGLEHELVKCLLRSNQPLLAQTCVEHLIKQHQEFAEIGCSGIGERVVDKGAIDRLREYQMEATCKLGDWDQLATLHQELNQKETVNDIAELWGAQIAMILCCLKHFDQHGFNENIEKARISLSNSLKAITLEDSSGTISQAHRNIVKLRSLYEMEKVRGVLYAGGDKSMLVRKIINEWERQTEESLSFAANSEPIVSLRRELLRAIDLPNTDQTQCRLLLECSTLARNSNHLQRSWTYIAEAKTLNGPKRNIGIDMEEAKYLFQKGEQFQAINLLEKGIENNFPELCTELENGSNLRFRDSTSKSEMSESIKTRRTSFVEAQLLLADFNERAGAKQMEDLLQTYESLEYFGQLFESFYYRYATFYDGYCESVNEIDNSLICTLLRLYRNVLDFGPRFIDHAIPRMLTIWLDLAPKCSITEIYGAVTGSGKKVMTGKAAQNQRQQKQLRVMTNDPNKIKFKEAFDHLDKRYFFSSYSQMISRITHSDPGVYSLLKDILSDLIVHFPHQCMWLSLAVLSSSHSKRESRCSDIFELAKKKAKAIGLDLNLLMQQYNFLATSLIQIAETQLPEQKKSNLLFEHYFPHLVDFFKNGAMRICSQTIARKSGPSVPPRLLLPFIDVMCSPSLGQFSGKASSFSSLPQLKEIFIHGIGPNFGCFQSLARPKKMTFVGSDGKAYSLLCKKGDDLRKDSRCVDVNRMLNTLFQRNTETKNQLYIRCYSVIPLKEADGGIIQWLPNLVTFGGALKELMSEKSPLMTTFELKKLLGENLKLTRGQRLQIFRDKLCVRFPLCMATWQRYLFWAILLWFYRALLERITFPTIRQNFLDACSWYSARMAFTRTAATMSMVGFLLGLGDRHGENILMDLKTGDVIHVDFNILFDKGEYLRVPECVPFRLTRNMIDGFGATGVEGTFRKSCEKALKVMRAEKRMLRTVLQAFAHDTLVEWETTETRNQQYRQIGGIAQHSQQNNASKTIEMINMRLAGHIVTARHNPTKDCAVPMSVEGQVAKLIDLAKDEQNLARMYIGWSPHV